ncbi:MULTISPECIES: glycosyltransferase [Brevibacterium]|uniref:Glycosyl transferase family 1 domain-containing protein n=1 Tax=Brevibacterium salitolerans TaxID=1403566 RepID=A0ABN2WRH0_9MICO|nr:glycosyltransferase [Brevibacterium sp.]
MKVLVDALAATKFSGGMRLHAAELIRAWSEAFPEDELVVAGGSSLHEAVADCSGVSGLRWPNERILTRAPGQVLATPVMRAITRADCCVSLSPIVSPLFRRTPAFCFQHDWRHLRRPAEFGAVQKAYRRLWEVSARHADLNICISAKTEAETREVVPGARTLVVENGRDHARRWRITPAQPSPSTVVTFGHHNNKRPELVIDALARLGPEGESVTATVLGARGSYGEELRARAVALGLGDRVRLPGFVTDDEYQQLIATASCIVLASSDEGFGLPLAEAQYFGIPGVTASDSGIEAIFEDAIVAAPEAAAMAAAITEALARPRGSVGEGLWRWADAAAAVRGALLNALQR